MAQPLRLHQSLQNNGNGPVTDPNVGPIKVNGDEVTYTFQKQIMIKIQMVDMEKSKKLLMSQLVV